MEESNKPVEEEVQVAGTEQEELNTETEVNPEVKETTEAPAVDEVDNEALIKTQDEIIAKLETEKDNYRKMALKYKKGEEPVEEVVPELNEDRIRDIYKEEYFNSEIVKAQKEKDDLLAKVLRENKELKIANLNSGKANLSAGGGGVEERKETSKELSPDLIKELKARAEKLKIDPDQYIKRYKINVVKPDAEKGATPNLA